MAATEDGATLSIILIIDDTLTYCRHATSFFTTLLHTLRCRRHGILFAIMLTPAPPDTSYAYRWRLLRPRR